MLTFYVIGIAAAAGLLALDSRRSAHVSAELAWTFALLPLLFFGLAVLVSWLNGAEATPSTLGGLTLAFHRRSVRWDSIGQVRYTELQGYPYLAISSTESHRRLYIPLEMVDREGFERLVNEYAGLEHPLSQWYRKMRRAV